MKRLFLFPRFFALWLTLGLALPHPALRPSAATRPPSGRPPAVLSLGPTASLFLAPLGARLPWSAKEEKNFGRPALRIQAGLESDAQADLARALQPAAAGVEEEVKARVQRAREGAHQETVPELGRAITVYEGLISTTDNGGRLLRDYIVANPEEFQGQRVWEIGVGQGASTLLLLRTKPQKLVGTDLLPEAVANTAENRSAEPTEIFLVPFRLGVSDLDKNLPQIAEEADPQFDRIVFLWPGTLRPGDRTTSAPYAANYRAGYPDDPNNVIRRTAQMLPRRLRPGGKAYVFSGVDEPVTNPGYVSTEFIRSLLPVDQGWKIEPVGRKYFSQSLGATFSIVQITRLAAGAEAEPIAVRLGAEEEGIFQVLRQRIMSSGWDPFDLSRVTGLFAALWKGEEELPEYGLEQEFKIGKLTLTIMGPDRTSPDFMINIAFPRGTWSREQAMNLFAAAAWQTSPSDGPTEYFTHIENGVNLSVDQIKEMTGSDFQPDLHAGVLVNPEGEGLNRELVIMVSADTPRAIADRLPAVLAVVASVATPGLLDQTPAAELEAVMKAIQAAVAYMGKADILGVVASLVDDQVMPVADYLSSSEMDELKRLGIDPLLVPSSLKAPSAIPIPSTIRLLMQPGFEGQIEGQMAGVAIEKVADPAQADFVIGNAAFMKTQRARAGAMNALFLQVDDPAFVEQITPTLLAQILHRRELFPGGTVLLIGMKVQGDFGEGLVFFA